MQDRDLGPQFDHDPNLDRPLRPVTQDFLQRFRNVDNIDEFSLNQLTGDVKEEGTWKRRGELGVWGTRFVNRLFSIESPAEADALLLPWISWGQSHHDLYEECMNQEGDTRAKYATYQERFREAGIPSELQEQMGEMSEDHFRYNANSYLFRFTRVIKESIDMLEELPRSVSANTVFRVQRITGESHWPVGGLQEAIKPNIKQTFVDGKPYCVLFSDIEEMEDLEDDATPAHWLRWNSLEVGVHVKNAQEGNLETFDKQFGSGGAVAGFDIGGAGDLMFYQPSLRNVVIYVREDGTGLLRNPLLRQVALDNEIVTIHHYTDLPFTSPTALITEINFGEGTVGETELPHEEVSGHIVKKIKKLIEPKEDSNLPYLDPRP